MSDEVGTMPCNRASTSLEDFKRCESGAGAVPNKYSREAWHTKNGNSPELLVDIGAVKPFTGGAFVKSKVADMQRHGFKAVYETLLVPEFMRGIGRGAQRSSQCVHLIGALHTGKLLGYIAFCSQLLRL